MVATGLARAGALPESGDLPTLRIAVQADPLEPLTRLARRIVAATLRELDRSA